jgi:hypothetical protein
MKKKLLVQAVLGACLSQLVVGYATAADWTPKLLEPATTSRGPTDPVRIRLPALPNSVLERLTLELDDFDVTSMVAREGTDAVFTPPTPLPFGPHSLRLVEFMADGSIVERGTWTVEIRKSSAFREGEMQVMSSVTVSRRVTDDNLPQTAPDKTQANGAARLQGVVADGNWRISGAADLLYNTQKNLTPRQKSQLDGGQFVIKAESGPVTATAGHQMIGPDSLVMSAFNRRGLSVGVGHDTDAANATAFALRAQDVIGFQEGLGIGDGDNRVSGATFVTHPVRSRPDALMIAATYVKGEGPSFTGTTGTGVAGDTFSTGGNAASLLADGNLVDHRLRLRGEYAQSNYDHDGIDTGEPAEKDSAYSALASYSLLRDVVANGSPVALDLTLDNRRIGTYFKSPASPFSLADRKSTRGIAALGWGGMTMQTILGKERSNVNGIELLDTTETTQKMVTLMYSPAPAPSADPTQPPATPWYGQPMYNLNYLNIDQEVAKESSAWVSGMPTAGPLTATRSLTGGATFMYPTWSWTVSHTIGNTDNSDTLVTNGMHDTESKMTSLNANFRIGDSLTIMPGVQRSEVTDVTQTDMSSETVTALLNLGYRFSDRVSSSFNYSINRNKIDNGSADTRTKDIIAALNWIAYPAMGARPGLTLSLEGQYHDLDDRVYDANTLNTYQVFLKATVPWSPTW